MSGAVKPFRLAQAGLFLLVLSGKLWMIPAAGTDVPQCDQWDAEGRSLLQPWVEGTLDGALLFEPHNEHRLVTSRLFLLGLFVMNGQWSGFLETVASAGCMPSAPCSCSDLRGWLTAGWLIAFGGILLALFTIPFAWETRSSAPKCSFTS